jgi:hypothetical protein
MKKIFSISLVFLFLLSGMHLSIATHICGGEVAAVKWSFSGKQATCGMESPGQSFPSGNGIASNCCQNKICVLTVDSNYLPSASQIKDLTKSLIQVFNVPVSLTSQNTSLLSLTYNNAVPPDIAVTSAVSLANICVFRI